MSRAGAVDSQEVAIEASYRRKKETWRKLGTFDVLHLGEGEIVSALTKKKRSEAMHQFTGEVSLELSQKENHAMHPQRFPQLV